MPSRFGNLKRSIFPKRTPIFAAAPTQNVSRESAGQNPSVHVSGEKDISLRVTALRDEIDVTQVSVDATSFDQVSITESSLASEITSSRKPNAFDKITKAAGSSYVFFVMLLLVGSWFVLGLVYGTTDRWQIVFQNTSSIQVYITDILLIRQQQNARRALLTTIAELQSRNKTCERLLAKIPGCTFFDTHKEGPKQLLLNGQPFETEAEKNLYMATGKPSRFEYVWTKICWVVSETLGSIYAFVIYWAGITVWIGIGPDFGFSNTWQLYINTATAVILTFTSVFLQNIQQKQEDNLEKCLHYALKIDAEVEYRLREITGDTKPNPIFEIPAVSRNWVEKKTDTFADIMGSGVGVAFSLLVTLAWICVGPILEFNDNWWLIIGTFAGLMGFVDGFVLRSLYYREEVNTKIQFQSVAISDNFLLDHLNIPLISKPVRKHGWAERISVWTGDKCGHRFAPAGAVLIVFGLLTIATFMRWSETGQLLCNTPTMIAEGFLLLVLIQAHNTSNEERGNDFNGVLKRRLLLNSYIHGLDE